MHSKKEHLNAIEKLQELSCKDELMSNHRYHWFSIRHRHNYILKLSGLKCYILQKVVPSFNINVANYLLVVSFT